jgi:hypothetical protein
MCKQLHSACDKNISELMGMTQAWATFQNTCTAAKKGQNIHAWSISPCLSGKTALVALEKKTTWWWLNH